jgi:putative endonuclease
MFCVYAVKSTKAGRIYVGQTNNIEQRLAFHNAGHVKATKAERPWKLIALQALESGGQAMWIEKSLKKSQGARAKWLEENKLNQ